jgi:hypothetical protein
VASERTPSYTERYRGTIYDARPTTTDVSPAGVAPGRIFVLSALIAMLGLFALAILILDK